MIFHRLLLGLLALLAVIFLPSCFLRPAIQKNKVAENSRYFSGPPVSKLQTPCYRLTDRDGRRVELVGAVHLAEKSYYQHLNRRFRSFDAVLVEGVGDLRSKGKDSRGFPRFRKLVYDKLHMSLQGDMIDYSRANIVHADFTTAGYAEARRRHGLGERPKEPLDQVAAAVEFEIMTRNLTDVRRALAVDLHATSQNYPGSKAEYQVDAVERERIVLDVLERQLAAGKRNLCIFYGSGHLPALRDELLARGWKLSGVEWLDAWVIPHPSAFHR
jgi:hypothetical protein